MSVSSRVEITNKRGLHARASAKFVTMADGFDARVTVEKDGNQAAGTSIMSLMMLAAGPGDHVVISAAGPEAEGAVEALSALVESKFGEE